MILRKAKSISDRLLAESTCHHPLLLFNREGDCLAAKLRPGNVHSADDWEELLLPEIEWQQGQAVVEPDRLQS